MNVASHTQYLPPSVSRLEGFDLLECAVYDSNVARCFPIGHLVFERNHPIDREHVDCPLTSCHTTLLLDRFVFSAVDDDLYV